MHFKSIFRTNTVEFDGIDLVEKNKIIRFRYLNVLSLILVLIGQFIILPDTRILSQNFSLFSDAYIKFFILIFLLLISIILTFRQKYYKFGFFLNAPIHLALVIALESSMASQEELLRYSSVVMIMFISIFLNSIFFSQNLMFFFISQCVVENLYFAFFKFNFSADIIIVQFYSFLIFSFALLTMIYRLQIDEFEHTIDSQKQELQNVMKARSQFFTKMSHEIRAPLNIVLGLIDLLADKNTDSKDIRDIHNIKIASNNLLIVVNDLLDFSKIEAGKMTPKHVEFNILELFSTLELLFKPLAMKKNINFQLNAPSTIPKYLKGSVDHLRHILINLIDNSMKFTKEQGTISLNVTYSILSNTTLQLQIIVKDTGIGIPEHHLPNLFQPFMQIENNENVTGTGLGLMIVKELTEVNNGTINVTSVEGIGTMFSLTFPFTIIENIETIIKPELEFKKLNILIADDFVENHDLLTALLRKYPFKLDFVLNGEEAINKIINVDHNYNLVFFDIRMPVKDGLEAMIEIRNWEKELRSESMLPIIAITANNNVAELNDYLEKGFTAYIVKPFSKDNLLSLIEKYQ